MGVSIGTNKVYPLDFPIYNDTSMGLTILYFSGSQVKVVTGNNYYVFLSLNVVLILANSADPDEMQHYAAFHLGLHGLPNYLFSGFQFTKG